MECELKNQCSGCTEWNTTYTKQLENKITHFKNELEKIEPANSANNIKILSINEFGLRDRLDFIIENQKMGLYSHQTKEILDIPKCLQLSPALQEYYTEFRKIKWPIKKGSFRLRSGPQDERANKGAWLDFSHEDVKKLFSEKETLHQLLILGFVEIGQRRKKLFWDEKDNRFRLTDPELNNWMNTTYLNQTLPLYSCVGSFSQVGHAANDVIIKTIKELCNGIKYGQFLDCFLEYGAGNGNLTFPALGFSDHGDLIETDILALDGLKKTLQENNLESKITIHNKTPKELNLKKFQLILANPPRSGLQDLLALLKTQDEQKQNLPKYFIYMSCFPESYFKDLQELKKLGYNFHKAFLVDQFPQTQHYEVLSLLVRE